MDMCEEFQSHPCTSIHHTYNDTLEWLGCCEMPESAKVTQSLCESGIHEYRTEANLHLNPDPKHVGVVTVLELTTQSHLLQPFIILGPSTKNQPHPQLISRGVVMVMPDGFQSQPCTSIHHTYNDTLEWLGCCEMPESAIVTQSLCEIVEYMNTGQKPTFIPTPTQNTLEGFRCFSFSVGHCCSEAEHQRHYVDALTPSALDFETRKKALLSDPEGLVLLAYGKSFTLAHSFNQFGGTLYRPENKVICLLGLHDSAAPFEVDVKSVLEEVETITPSFEAIWNCESVAELKALEIPEKITRTMENHHHFSSCSVLFMPPWAEEATLDFEPCRSHSRRRIVIGPHFAPKRSSRGV
eukprot:scaffold67029_cov68-Cyclotella_meneghiniana.AAC.7